MMRLPRELMLFGRPLGEWPYLALLCLIASYALQEFPPAGVRGAVPWAVAVGQLAIGVTALGIVITTLTGRIVGLRLLWLMAGLAIIVAPLATWGVVGAPAADVVIAAFGAMAASVGVVWYGRRRLHAAVTRRVWPSVLAEHAAAADEYAATIGGLMAAQWSSRPAPDGWSAAEITDHLARTYSQYAGESRGKDSLRIQLGFVRLLLARTFVKPRLLNGAPFPKARSPRALRPTVGPETPADGVALFRATGEACVRDLSILAERRPHRQLVHPFLGHLPLYDVVRFAAQHIRHHHRQLRAAIAPSAQEERHDHAS